MKFTLVKCILRFYNTSQVLYSGLPQKTTSPTTQCIRLVEPSHCPSTYKRDNCAFDAHMMILCQTMPRTNPPTEEENAGEVTTSSRRMSPRSWRKPWTLNYLKKRSVEQHKTEKDGEELRRPYVASGHYDKKHIRRQRSVPMLNIPETSSVFIYFI